jgi:hypothetical protein
LTLAQEHGYRSLIMQTYKNLNRNSGIKAYELGEDFIQVVFNDGDTYLYTYESAGKRNIEEMKKLAVSGKGLSTFISTKIKKRYASKSTM